MSTGLLVMALALGACQAHVDPGATLIDGEPLRTSPSTPPGARPCMAALASGTLAADASDPARVWLAVANDGSRVDLIWPNGFRVRFTPDAEVLAPNGEVVVRDGEDVALGGGLITDAFEICTVNGQNWLTAPLPAAPSP